MWLTIGIASIGLAVTSVFIAHAQIPPPDEPKSWIPERQAEEGSLTALVDPPLSEAEKRERRQLLADATDLPLQDEALTQCIADAAAASVTIEPLTPHEPSEEFSAAYTKAGEMMSRKLSLDALAPLAEAEQHADSVAQILAIEQLRMPIYASELQHGELVASLERQLATGGLPLHTVSAHCRTIEQLKAMPSYEPTAEGAAKP